METNKGEIWNIDEKIRDNVPEQDSECSSSDPVVQEICSCYTL